MFLILYSIYIYIILYTKFSYLKYLLFPFILNPFIFGSNLWVGIFNTNSGYFIRKTWGNEVPKYAPSIRKNQLLNLPLYIRFINKIKKWYFFELLILVDYRFLYNMDNIFLLLLLRFYHLSQSIIIINNIFIYILVNKTDFHNYNEDIHQILYEYIFHTIYIYYIILYIYTICFKPSSLKM